MALSLTDAPVLLASSQVVHVVTRGRPLRSDLPAVWVDTDEGEPEGAGLMSRLTTEREREIRWSLANVGPFGSGPALEDLLDEVDALRADSMFLNDAVTEACADRDYFARQVDMLVADNDRLNEALSQAQARAEHAELRLAEQLAEGRYPGES